MRKVPSCRSLYPSTRETVHVRSPALSPAGFHDGVAEDLPLLVVVHVLVEWRPHHHLDPRSSRRAGLREHVSLLLRPELRSHLLPGVRVDLAEAGGVSELKAGALRTDAKPGAFLKHRVLALLTHVERRPELCREAGP